MTHPENRPARTTYLALCPAEPFRIFFPLGVLFGISGVSLWPLFYLGLHTSFYPGMMHARVMIEGFLGAFIFGFLGTAMPRVIGAPPLKRCELWALVVLHLTAIGLHIGLQPFAGDGVFLVLLVFFLVCMGRRFARRADMPPPGFSLVGLGFLNALAGTSLLASAPWNVWTFAIPLGTALLNEVSPALAEHECADSLTARDRPGQDEIFAPGEVEAVGGVLRSGERARRSRQGAFGRIGERLDQRHPAVGVAVCRTA